MAKRVLDLICPRSNPNSASFFKLARHSVSIAKGTVARSLPPILLGLSGGWISSNGLLPAQAATLINNSGLEFEQDTTVDSNFIESHGAYQSTFGIMDLETKQKTPLLTETKPSDQAESIFKPSTRSSHLGTNTDFRGLPNVAVPNPTARFTFKANKQYVLYLESSFNGRPTGIVYSNNVLNPNREQQVKFAGGANDLCTSGVMVNWDDTGSKLVRNRAQQDRDFDDFVVQLKGTACAIGGGELPPVVSQLPSPPSVGRLPGRRGGFPWPLLLLGAIPAFDGDGSKSSNSPGVSPSVPPGPRPTPTNSPGPKPSPPNPPGPRPTPTGGPTPTPTPTESIPEPMTILGSGTAIAFGAFMQRRRKRKGS